MDILAVKFFILLLAVNADGTPYDQALYPVQARSIQECLMQLPEYDQIMKDGRRLYFRCVVQSGA